MWWKYLIVFICSLAVDLVPFPLPPAFSIMIFFLVLYDLNIWAVLAIGFVGSLIGRYTLMIYLPNVSSRIFKTKKNQDVQFLTAKLRKRGWQGFMIVFIYSMVPLPSTPLFIAGGMAGLKPIHLLPGFALGKAVTDTIVILLGNYAAKNSGDIFQSFGSLKSMAGLALGLLLLFALFFIDWRKLLQHKKLSLNFHIWK